MEIPILRRKPSYATITQALEILKLKPSSWEGNAEPEDAKLGDDGSDNAFLMSVIMSEFEWLQDTQDKAGKTLSIDEQKERLVQEASSRISERCGRSAAGEMTRTWVIPKSLNTPEIRFDIREPPLTGDQIGLKTWGTSFVLAKRLEYIGSEYLGALVDNETISYLPTVLELGAGTGLVGMAAAAVWSTNVLLTDLEDIQDNLLFNINKNIATVTELNGSISGDVLDWTKPQEALELLIVTQFEIVIAADPMYDHEHPALVVEMITKFLKKGSESRALVAIPLRDTHTEGMALNFSTLMENSGFSAVYRDHESFKDDWTSEDDVQVQWTIWRWVDRTLTP
ncbi:uncharacterized protein RAG0_07500 [Rhynchosporium agropyri]|uniref:N2,N2-dimethylguanosine tRNA methyltransferase n=1 Tax=Rhynchosporium agropyri TaxID=914238 RepID=A0A1E1KLX7_9HELO|nr:uncharacterized protein RAG0_07500 [Rhynchosporium agropyri]